MLMMMRRDLFGSPLTLVLALALAPAVIVAAAKGGDDRPRATFLAAAAGPAALKALAPDDADDKDDDDDEDEDAMDVNKLPSLSVSGVGKVSAAPDTADVSVGVITQAAGAKEAMAANTEAMTKLIATLKEQGIPEKDIQTQNLSIQPQYTQPPRNNQNNQEFVPKIASYQVTNTVQITARKLDALGGILDAVVRSGANQMYGISFRVDEPEKLMDEARVAAVRDAGRKAEQIARAAGVKLGAPIHISEGGAQPMPRPMMRAAAPMMMMAASAPVPVAGGEQDFSVSVSVTFQIVTEGHDQD